MRPVLFNLGYFSIHSWGVLVALGAVVGLFVARRRAGEIGLDFEHVLDLALYLMVGGLLGARLLYLTFYPTRFIAHPDQILAVSLGGMSIHGAVVGGLVAGFIFAKRRKVSFWKFADLVAPSVIIGQAIGRIGCFLNGDSYGLVTSVPWAVKFPGLSGTRHPTQLYEAVLDLAAFAFIWRRRDKALFKGELFLLYIVTYSSIRMVVEFFRASPKVLGPISPAQIASVLAIVGAGSLIAMARHLARVEFEKAG